MNTATLSAKLDGVAGKIQSGTEERETGVYRCQSDWRGEQNTQAVERPGQWVLSTVRPQNRTIL